MSKTTKMLDLVVNHPQGPLFDHNAQLLFASGVFLFFALWGIAKIIKAWRNPK